MFIYSTPTGPPPEKPRRVGANTYMGGQAAAVHVAADIIAAEKIDVVDIWVTMTSDGKEFHAPAMSPFDVQHVARVHRDGGVDYAGPGSFQPVPPEVTS